ncbi:nitroreductase family deazaflavin-dependent oxidoreductase [Demequina mangrovi]|uniref:Deazaflavin-dependent oxidoreductase, nitroreductase family n=1 Tax=Demequina mangrovi TaxID=1043493 RepID=A0A1H6WYT0_9MICO|nr:nitroreductase family deazaflavin-dependent oxidoreductase [Demequina mangrovi]SEJ17515.1 deazaflavin-dependent oxidoreductase, nitroreductase family [Demequina mangrovi]
MTSAMDLHGPAHVARYLETDGADGHDWRRGTTVLLLTTIGRKSGEARTSPLIYREWGDAYLVVASKGGADAPPAWFLNLAANPDVTVQIRAERFAARARTATAEEKPAMWGAMVEAWPDYDSYQAGTEREIPVVVLERT